MGRRASVRVCLSTGQAQSCLLQRCSVVKQPRRYRLQLVVVKADDPIGGHRRWGEARQQAWQHMHKAARARDKLGHTSEIKDWAGAVEVVNAWQQESQQLTAVLRRS